MELNTRLSTLAGRPLDFHERNQISSLKNDLEFLATEIKAKKQVLDFLDEHEKSLQVEHEAEIRYDASRKDSLYNEIGAIKKRSKLLFSYVTMLSTDEFNINRLHKENQEYCHFFWLKLKDINEKSRTLVSELEQLKEMYNTCLQLKHQANGLMAPSH